MAKGHLLKGINSKSVLAYVIEQDGQYLAHARTPDEPESAEGALKELRNAGVPPIFAFMLSGYDLTELHELSEARWEEPVELEYIGEVEE